VWIVSQATKWWVLDPAPDAAPAAFVSAGDDIAAYLRQMPIDCALRSDDGVFHNPGCDPAVQAAGFSSMGFLMDAHGVSHWIATRDTRWWIYQVGPIDSGTYVAAGADLAEFLRGFAPDCTATTVDGILLNPGCDAEVMSHGITDGDMIELDGAPRGLLNRGTKWWLFKPGAAHDEGEFVDGGTDVAAFLRRLLP
jgi:hypothetical protein